MKVLFLFIELDWESEVVSESERLVVKFVDFAILIVQLVLAHLFHPSIYLIYAIKELSRMILV